MFLDFFVQYIASFPYHLWRRWELFLKKCYLPDNFDLFSLILLSMATSWSNSIGPKKIQTTTVQVKIRFCNIWVKVENTNFGKKVTFPVKTTLFAFLLVIPGFADVQGNFIHKVFKQTLVQVKRSILKDLISCWKQNILKEGKKANIPMKKNLLFFLYYRAWQTWKHFFKGPRGLWTFIVQLIRYKIVFVRLR